ncbi:hypothetical protein CALVIDRAFT_489779, partial [Calocera viscosa TUFC12733]
MPAVAKLMNFKGHNGFKPCRFCEIPAVRAENNRVNCIPLDRAAFPPLRGYPSSFLPDSLTFRTHEQLRHTAERIVNAESDRAAEDIAKDSGVKGDSIWRIFGSIVWPWAFPLDFMHLLFENVAPLLLGLWAGENRHGSEEDDFIIPYATLSAIAEQVAESGNTIPSTFGRRVPHLLNKRHEFIAETWMLWIQQLAPVVLSGRFTKDAHYTHLVDLSRCVNDCLDFGYRAGFAEKVRRTLARWVTKYEHLYF